MTLITKMTAGLLATLALAACGGGGGGGGTIGDDYLSSLASLQSDMSVSGFTPNSTLSAMSSTASYKGVANVGDGSAAYLGELDVSLNFASDTVSGSAKNFVEYYSMVASPTTGNPVSGSLSIAGNLTGSNETMTDGIAGTATGSIDGSAYNMTVEGNVMGVNATMVNLWFDGAGTQGGVGMAGR